MMDEIETSNPSGMSFESVKLRGKIDWSCSVRRREDASRQRRSDSDNQR